MFGGRFRIESRFGRAASLGVISLAAAISLSLGGCSLLNGAPVSERTVRVVRTKSVDPYLIGSDDKLDIIVWKQPQLSGIVRVANDGTIAMPLIGRVRAAGLRPDKLQEELQADYAQYVHDAGVTVRVSDPASHVFYALGEVAKPGAYPLHSGEVLSQALAQAGGLGPFADPGKIRILRHRQGETIILTVNYNVVASGKNVSADIPIEPRDTINVP
jgi:polysaccharide biosynthesis/export protein